MNRRQLMMFSGALAAHEGLAAAQSQQAPGVPKHTSKVLLKYIRARASYKVPKTEVKVGKYLNKVAGLLNLSPAQQQQAATIYHSAMPSTGNLRTQLKTARKSLKEAVSHNDSASISQLSAAIGSLSAQLIGAGAAANSAFFQILTPDQQAKLLQFKKQA
jgi:Spy/CpxP family protein refolding chaperone